MIHPMRVEWTVQDDEKRAAAELLVKRDLERMRQGQEPDLERQLLHRSGKEHVAEVWRKRYPELDGKVTMFGTLLSVRYVPAQYAARHYDRGGIDLGTTGVTPFLLCKAKWVALVATEIGTVEMDPLTLRVMWPCAPGDPIGGVVATPALPQA